MQENERMVSLRSLVIMLMKKWKLLLLGAVILGLLAAAYKAKKDWPAGQTQTPPSEKKEAAEDYSHEFELIDSTLRSKSQYLKESIMARIDENAEGRAVVKVTIKVPGAGQADESDYSLVLEDTDFGTGSASKGGTDQPTIGVVTQESRDLMRIMNGYKDYLFHALDWTAEADRLETKPQYLQELLSVKREDLIEGSFKIVVIYPDQEGAEEILGFVLGQLEANRDLLAERYGNHELAVSEVASSTVVDTTLTSWMNDHIRSMNDLMNSQDTFKTATAALTPASAASVPSRRDVARGMVKFGLAGFVGGGLAAAVLLVVYSLLAQVILTGRDLNRQYGFTKLADYPEEGGRGLSRLASRLDRRYWTSSDPDQAAAAAACHIGKLVKEGAEVLLTGDISPEKLERIRERLTAGKEDLRFRAAAHPVTFGSGLDSLESAEALVIVAEAGRSRYTDIDELIELSGIHEKRILGTIVLE